MKSLISARRGFALTTAIMLLGLVGVAAVAVTTLLAADARRTYGAAEEAQLRQLLTAGALDAQARLAVSAPPAAWSVAIPIELAGDASVDVSVSLTSDFASEASTRDVHIRATLGTRHLSQTVRFRPGAGGRWSAAETLLGR